MFLFLRRPLLLLIISIFPSIFFAQNKGQFIIGPVLGINYATVFGDGIDSLNQRYASEQDQYTSIPGISSDGAIYSRIGLNAGFSLEYYFIDNIAFSTGLLYSQKGFIEHNSLEINTGLDFKQDERKKINLNYFDLPLLVAYQLKHGIKLSGGLILSFLVSDKVLIELTEIYQINDSLSGNIITITEHTSDQKDYDDVVDNNDPNALLTGIQIGASYTIKRLNFSINLNRNNRFGHVAGKNKNNHLVFQFCTRLYF